MGRPKSNTSTLTQQATRRGAAILARLDVEGSDFMHMDDRHAYLWNKAEVTPATTGRCSVIAALSPTRNRFVRDGASQ